MLSNEEIKTAQRLIAQYRRFALKWKVMRWLVLLVALCFSGISVFGYFQMEELAANNVSTYLAVNPDKAAGDMDDVLDVRINLLRVELRMYTGLIISWSIGVLLLFVVLYNWNRQGPLTSLKAKLLEAALEKEHQSGE